MQSKENSDNITTLLNELPEKSDESAVGSVTVRWGMAVVGCPRGKSVFILAYDYVVRLGDYYIHPHVMRVGVNPLVD